MSRPFLALAVFVVTGWACADPSAPADDPLASAGSPTVSELMGTWQLDPVTQEWLPRACVRLTFPDAATPTFDVQHDGNGLVVQLHTTDRTTWRSQRLSSVFRAQQILPTTESGRFCGRETPVRLSLRAAGPDILQGVWQTPGCDLCPDRHFGAIRSPARGAGADR